jgi:hypothetical protein
MMAIWFVFSFLLLLVVGHPILCLLLLFGRCSVVVVVRLLVAGCDGGSVINNVMAGCMTDVHRCMHA